MPPSRTEKAASRVHIMLDVDELAEIDAFFHDARLKSRSEAIRKLISMGLAVHDANFPVVSEKPEQM